MQSDSKLNGSWIKKGKQMEMHYAKVLQLKFKHIEKTKNAEQELLRKSKNIIVLLVDATLAYHRNNNIPKLTQDENDYYYLSNSRILVILHRIATSVIQTFTRMFVLSCGLNVCLFVEEGEKQFQYLT